MKIVIENLHKIGGELEILKNVNISFENVATVGIIGESGCEKNLLRQLAGIEDLDSGEIYINSLSPITQKLTFQEKLICISKTQPFPSSNCEIT